MSQRTSGVKRDLGFVAVYGRRNGLDETTLKSGRTGLIALAIGPSRIRSQTLPICVSAQFDDAASCSHSGSKAAHEVRIADLGCRDQSR